jgi:hypothetical protein
MALTLLGTVVVVGAALSLLTAYRVLRTYRTWDRQSIRVDVEWFDVPVDLRDESFRPGAVYVAVTATNIGRQRATVTSVGLETDSATHISIAPGRARSLYERRRISAA